MKWEKVKLGDVCEITSSKRIFYSEYVDDGVPFYRSKEIIESDEGKIIENPLYISVDKHRLTRAHREKQLKTSCQALHNAPPNRT